MKKRKLGGKLSLNKETISKLNGGELEQVKGGDFTSFIGSNCNGCETETDPGPVSSPDNLETCEGATCDFLDGCA